MRVFPNEMIFSSPKTDSTGMAKNIAERIDTVYSRTVLRQQKESPFREIELKPVTLKGIDTEN